MLEHQKLVLTALKNSHLLFLKEIEKSFIWLNAEEIRQLEDWLKSKFPQYYEDEIKYLFLKIPA